MTARFKKKVRKMRGSHTHGWGAKKKHRGAGSRGGAGRSGHFFQKKSYVTSYAPERIGKKGFAPKTGAEPKAINLRQIEGLAFKNNLKEVDVARFGYQKVLAGGRLTAPITIKANVITENAKAKIEEAGGKAVTEKEEGE
ncbi:MAG: uL15m family ribosomal protein [Candidatus Aenigmatarchaeota archaeon]